MSYSWPYLSRHCVFVAGCPLPDTSGESHPVHTELHSDLAHRQVIIGGKRRCIACFTKGGAVSECIYDLPRSLLGVKAFSGWLGTIVLGS